MDHRVTGQDAFRWLHDKGPELLAIDPAKMVVTGGSAGGYLTMMTGIRVKPCPQGLVSYWGYRPCILVKGQGLVQSKIESFC
jgi:acetyl esterase/lipase